MVCAVTADAADPNDCFVSFQSRKNPGSKSTNYFFFSTASLFSSVVIAASSLSSAA
jgi:hypothetical protein